jgi:hypothetical protein
MASQGRRVKCRPRVRELIRFLSGQPVHPEALEHARVLIGPGLGKSSEPRIFILTDSKS